MNAIVAKVNARLKFLYRNCKYFSIDTKKSLASALIQCYFDYSCSSWYAGLTVSLQNKLQVLQNKVVRFILDLPPRCRITNDMLRCIGFLNVNDRVRQLRLNHVFNIYHDTAPNYLKQHFNKVSNCHSRTRFSKFNFTVPKLKSFDSGTFYVNAISDWNSLPDKIKQIEQKYSFKFEVKRHLLECAKLKGNSDIVSY